jgi:hypothetical protein
MSCLACFWYHTDPRAAIACYRMLPASQNDRNPGARTGIGPSPIGPVSRPSTSPTSGPVSRPSTSPTSDTVFRRGRASRSGRPKVTAAVQRQRARDRDRAYRQRRKADRPPSSRPGRTDTTFALRGGLRRQLTPTKPKRNEPV